MSAIYTILPSTTTVAEAARLATARGCGVYLTPHGQAVLAPAAKPGWQRIVVREKVAA